MSSIMGEFPCRDCTDERHPGCHDTCKKFLDVKERRNQVKTARYEEKRKNGITIESILRKQKAKKNRKAGNNIIKNHKK